MTVSTQDAGTSAGFEQLFEVHRCSNDRSIEAEVERVRPAVVCFDFDFPSKSGLKLLQQTKRDHVSVPLIMLTVQHSEALAVWAFRSRAWDYLVKPLSKTELDRCLACLAEMLNMRDPATKRTAAMPASLIPPENRSEGVRGRQPQALAPAISYVERHFREKVSSTKAAALCGLSPFQFSRVFKESYDLTFQEYLLRFRIREACRLLKNPAAQVTDVACLVGFNDPSYFTKIFKRYTHISPSRFAEANAAALEPDRLLESLSGD
jgi:YesN/AraC family two-component response regulator